MAAICKKGKGTYLYIWVETICQLGISQCFPNWYILVQSIKSVTKIKI